MRVSILFRRDFPFISGLPPRVGAGSPGVQGVVQDGEDSGAFTGESTANSKGRSILPLRVAWLLSAGSHL